MVNMESSQAESQKKTWLVVAVFILLVSILRGIRIPSVWGYTHFLFNYDAGFTKRSIIGEIYKHIDNYTHPYGAYIAFSTLIFSLNIACIIQAMKKLIESCQDNLIACSILFASSLAITYLAHTVGYYDHVGFLAAFLIINISSRPLKFLLAIPLIAFCLLVHEGFLLIFFPSIFLSLILASVGSKKWMRLSFCMAFFAAVIAFILSEATLNSEAMAKLYGELQAHTDIALRGDAFAVLGRNIDSNLEIMIWTWGGLFAIANIFSWLVTLPSCAFFMASSLPILKVCRLPHVTWLLVLASLSPLSMHVIAWDMHRWNALAVTTSFLCLYAVFTGLPKVENSPESVKLLPILVLLVFLNGASTIGLFEGYSVRQFPFLESVFLAFPPLEP
jgi:hypothetical protein